MHEFFSRTFLFPRRPNNLRKLIMLCPTSFFFCKINAFDAIPNDTMDSKLKNVKYLLHFPHDLHHNFDENFMPEGLLISIDKKVCNKNDF